METNDEMKMPSVKKYKLIKIEEHIILGKKITIVFTLKLYTQDWINDKDLENNATKIGRIQISAIKDKDLKSNKQKQ